MSDQVPNDPRSRSLMVRAYAHSIMEDLLSDYAIAGGRLPDSLESLSPPTDYGMRFEETTLQFNAPQWSSAGTEEERMAGEEFAREALAIVNRWLKARAEAETPWPSFSGEPVLPTDEFFAQQFDEMGLDAENSHFNARRFAQIVASGKKTVSEEQRAAAMAALAHLQAAALVLEGALSA